MVLKDVRLDVAIPMNDHEPVSVFQDRLFTPEPF